ncbi:conjugal transfer pilus assembly protein TraH [Escherichia coli]
MLRIKPLLVLCAALLTVTPAASADVNSDMNQFFNKLGFASNTTQPGVWQGQAAGYAYGGSLYARTQVKNIQLISMTLPDINAGCGGIDAYLGSFSFINGDQLQRFVKQIMSNAAGYFFDLALQATVPEIKTAKDFLQKMASDINSMNLSSCQVAQGIVGGLFPQTQVSQQKVCQDIAGESNIFADWAASRQGCTVGGQSSSVRDKASDKDKERVLKNINIIWDSLSKNRMLDGNKELKEFIMTLTGTLIFGEDSEITPLPARTTDRDILRAIMEGGTAKVYHCNDSDKCLKVVADANVTIARDKALKAILTNTSSPEIAERRRAMAWSFVQEQVQPGVDNAWRESRGDIGKGMESVPSGGGSQDIIADHQGHQAIIEQRTQDSNIRNDVKHQVDNMVTEYRGNIGDTQNSIRGEENIVRGQYSELQNHHKTEALSQNNKYNEERESQKIIPEPSEEAVKKMVDDKKDRLKGPL